MLVASLPDNRFGDVLSVLFGALLLALGVAGLLDPSWATFKGHPAPWTPYLYVPLGIFGVITGVISFIRRGSGPPDEAPDEPRNKPPDDSTPKGPFEGGG